MLFIVCRGHPTVCRIDMLHAADYSNMQMAQLTKKLHDAKKTDKDIAAAIQ